MNEIIQVNNVKDIKCVTENALIWLKTEQEEVFFGFFTEKRFDIVEIQWLIFGNHSSRLVKDEYSFAEIESWLRTCEIFVCEDEHDTNVLITSILNGRTGNDK